MARRAAPCARLQAEGARLVGHGGLRRLGRRGASKKRASLGLDVVVLDHHRVEAAPPARWRMSIPTSRATHRGWAISAPRA